MVNDLKPLLSKFMTFAKDRLNFQNPPKLFLKQDSDNSQCLLGKTAHYDPAGMIVTLYISGRHPKDIMRSFAHELVHHCQNERGDLAPEKMKTLNNNYAQENEHMRKMEEEAYLQGNMCFRDWEDGLDNKLKYKMQVAEQNYLKKENKKMSVKKQKLTKGLLKETIEKLLNKKLNDPKKKNLDEYGAGRAHPMAGLPRPDKKARAAAKEYAEVYKEYIRSAGMLVYTLLDNDAFFQKMYKGDEQKELAKMFRLATYLIESEARRDAEFSAELHGFRNGIMDDQKAGESLAQQRADVRGQGVLGALDKFGPDSVPSQFADDGELKKAFKNATQMADDEEEPDPRRFRRQPKTVPEGKIKTPEEENTLYEARFKERNSNLFEKLLKEWTK
jgi:hypothetical protein